METKQLSVIPFKVIDIKSNYDDVKKSLVKVLEKYQDLTFDEYQVKDAKKVRADLNKLKKAINDKKIEVKKEYLKPYTDFETKAKELMLMVDEPCALIDTQVKSFEVKQREEKENFVQNLIDDLTSEIGLCVEIKDEWLNSSFSNKKIKDEIDNMIAICKENLSAIELLQSELKDELEEIVLNGGGMDEVLQEKLRLEMLQNKFKEKEVEKQEVKEKEIEATITTNDVEKEKTFTLKITCTVKNSIKLKLFMQENDIKAERIGE